MLMCRMCCCGSVVFRRTHLWKATAAVTDKEGSVQQEQGKGSISIATGVVSV